MPDSDQVESGPLVIAYAGVSDNVRASGMAHRPSAAAIQTWLIEYLARRLNLEQGEIDVTIPFERYGLSSADAFELMGDLQGWLETEFDPTLPYDFPTIAGLSKRLADGDLP